MQVGDALVGVDHGEVGAVGKRGVESSLDFLALIQVLQALVNSAQAVLAIEAGSQQLLAVLVIYIGEEGADDVAEEDGVRDLHHGGLQVGGEEHAFFLGALDLCDEELIQGLGGHEGAVDDLTLENRQLRQQGLLAIGSLQDDGQGVLVVQNDGLLIVTEVVVCHGGNVGLGVLGPLAHAVRVLLHKVLHGLRCAAVGVALTQHRVNSGALDGIVAGSEVLFFLGGRIIRVIRQVVAGSLQLGDGLLQLHQGSGNIRQLDDICFRGLGHLAQLCQGVFDLLLLGQALWELRGDAGGQRDIAGFHVDASGGSEGLHDGLEGVGRQQRRLIGTGPRNLCHDSPI